jgi:hypothetical protein
MFNISLPISTDTHQGYDPTIGIMEHSNRFCSPEDLSNLHLLIFSWELRTIPELSAFSALSEVNIIYALSE